MKGAPVSRLAVVLSHPTQYYSPWFRWLRSQTDLNFKVFYLWEFGVADKRDPQFGNNFKWDVDLLSGYEHEFVPNAASDPGAHHFWGFRNPVLTSRLAAWKPDALLLFGYNWATHLRVIAWARRKRIPLIFRGDSHLLGRPNLPWRRALPLRLLFSQFAAITYVGGANRAYFEALGVSPKRLFFAPHAVNEALFNPQNAEHHRNSERIRAELGIASATRVVLFAGKLVSAKQPLELLRAFVVRPRPGAALVYVGEGEEKGTLQEAANRSRRETGHQIHFLPFANQSEMPARYLMADVFALPSRGLYETWGLAVNEAMHLGVPCLVSDRVGCRSDLITSGETGWYFRAADPTGLGQALDAALEAVATSEGRQNLRRAVQARISQYTYKETTIGLLAALKSL